MVHGQLSFGVIVSLYWVPICISSPHRGKWLHVYNLLPPVHCMSSCYFVRLFGGYFFVFYSFRLRARNQIRLCIYSISPNFLDALSSGHIALLFFNSSQGKHTFEIILPHCCLPSFTNSLPKSICSAWSLPLFLMKKAKFNSKLRNLPLAAC